MCGRYYLAAKLRDLMEWYGIESTDIDYVPRYNIAPTQYAPVILGGEKRILKLFRWGLVPSWSKDLGVGQKMINARSETLSEKPSFREAFKKRRCIVPASGFYEWNKAESKRIPYRFYVPNRPILSMAGLWDIWRSETGENTYSFTIITTEPNETIKPYHHRMAVLLEPDEENLWLDENIQDIKRLSNLLKPYEGERLEKQRVSEAVNSVRNDFATLLDPVEESVQLRFDL
ncbi:SOS response-associated peptidase [Geosporobacter ferrireducens]|uniref:Abasic site processing protein n=1 Tax=Geosporobacter ferrireducens TaxID=1424294 RepID=A0A1D8GD66_9FIRM|nr:SOS response-associated peptidase [Geosporobacter ferrireducens]AOT68822.1 hypothetical protein Gferi_04200 [Geosporobacter ferrireducens]MTI56486.1 SOS response-associated peptidase [Geosporobacter ferrireducens]